MSQPDLSSNDSSDSAVGGGAAFPLIFVRIFSGKRAIMFWMLLAFAGFAVMLAFGRGATEENVLMMRAQASEAPEVGPAASDDAVEAPTEEKREMSRNLPETSASLLASMGWKERVGAELGIWVSIREQMFRILRGTEIVMETKCSTAARGPGSKVGSLQTPLGWHSVAEKFGDGAPWGQVFREKRATKDVWKPGEAVKEDLVLTRVLTLRGEEPGRNKGGDVDSFNRGIYIHGTNGEENIGTPASHGCVRLTNSDAIAVFPMIPLNTPVLITEE